MEAEIQTSSWLWSVASLGSGRSGPVLYSAGKEGTRRSASNQLINRWNKVRNLGRGDLSSSPRGEDFDGWCGNKIDRQRPNLQKKQNGAPSVLFHYYCIQLLSFFCLRAYILQMRFMYNMLFTKKISTWTFSKLSLSLRVQLAVLVTN